MGGVCAPPPYRQQLWASVPLGPVARVAVCQAVVGLLVLMQTTPDEMNRVAVLGLTVLGMVTLPLGRLVATLSRDHPRTYYWSGRAWAVALPVIFSFSVADAYDGTGAAFADNMMTPFMLPCAMGVAFAIGAQGALLGVPTELTLNMAATMLAMSAIKLQRAYTHPYALLHVMFLGGLALGYACVSKYADLHEAMRDAAEELMRAAVAITQPYLITDDRLRVLAVNRRFCDVLGYDADEIYGMHASTLLETSLDVEWVEAALAKEQTDHVWSVVCKDQTTMPVRITLATQRCPVNATKFYCAKLASMYLEQRNAQLQCEKERLQWDLVSQHGSEGDPHEALGDTRAIHQVARKDEEGDRHQHEDADARCDTLDRDDGRDVHREETGECCCEQRKGHRHTDNEKSKEHAEQDKQFHQPSPSPAESSAMCRPLITCGSANITIRRPETGSGT